MFRGFKSWRPWRWFAFAISAFVDGYAFYVSKPFTPESYQAAGIIALLLFIIFAEVGRQMRGRRRIRSELNDKEKVVYQVGQHLAVLIRNIRKNRFVWCAIWIPMYLAILTTLFWIGWVAWQTEAHPAWLDAIYTALPDNRYAFAGYMPLILAIPFALESIAEWTSHQYALAVDQISLASRLIIVAGVLRYDSEVLALERTVKIRVRQSFAESMIGIGDVELYETSGGSEGDHFKAIWRPRLLAKRIHDAIAQRRRKQSPEHDIE